MNTFWFPKTSFSDPNYVPKIFKFETTSELLSLPPVSEHIKPGSQLMMSDEYLMVILNEGFEWWVVGRIGKPQEVCLPKWPGPKIKVKFDDGREIVANNVSSICGDIIKLKDGSIGTRIK